jgi:hypothetical protein
LEQIPGNLGLDIGARMGLLASIAATVMLLVATQVSNDDTVSDPRIPSWFFALLLLLVIAGILILAIFYLVPPPPPPYS